MTDYVSSTVKDSQAVLDLCSSWTSHISPDQPIPRVAGLGMNSKELQANPVLTDWAVQDLNDKPVLPYKDDEFDVVLCQLSIDYLTKPLEVCKEVSRVLKPGGTVHIIFSNRLFLSKAVAIWTGADDIDHSFLVSSYLHFCGGFEEIEAVDLSVRKGRQQQIVGDPLYVVRAKAT
jgi:SAM-dependent methyltransferase